MEAEDPVCRAKNSRHTGLVGGRSRELQMTSHDSSLLQKLKLGNSGIGRLGTFENSLDPQELLLLCLELGVGEKTLSPQFREFLQVRHRKGAPTSEVTSRRG